MKKLAIGMFAVISVIIMSFALAACGASLEGTYKFQSATVQGPASTIELNVGKPVWYYTEDAIVLEADGKGNVQFTISVLGASETLSGTWRSRAGKIYVTLKGVETETTLKDGVLTLIYVDGATTITCTLIRQENNPEAALF